MEFSNHHLSIFINDNTPKVIQKRGMDLLPFDFEMDDRNEMLHAKVKGTELYFIILSNYKSAKIKATCTCPYNQTKVCKHIVAVTKMLDEYLELEDSFLTNHKSTPILSSGLEEETTNLGYEYKRETNSFIIPKQFIKELTIYKLIDISGKAIYNQSQQLYLSEVLHSSDNSSVVFNFQTSYWSNYYFECTATFTEDKITLRTECQCKDGRICKHNLRALKLLSTEYSYLTASKEEINQQKEELLKEFGFTLQDDNYQKYFGFIQTPSGLELQHKVKGIIDLDNIKMLSDFKSSVIDSDQLTESYLPKTKKKPAVKKESKIGFTLDFLNNGTDTYIIPIIGNVDANGEIHSNIQQITHKLLIDKQDQFSDEEVAIIKTSYTLTHEESKPHEKGYYASKISLFNELIHKANTLKAPFFELIDFNYSSQKVYKKNLYPVNLESKLGELSFEVSEKDNFMITNSYLKFNRKKKLTSYKAQKYYLFAREKDTFYLHQNKNTCDVVKFFSQSPDFKVVKKDFNKFQQNILIPIEEKYSVTYLSKPKQKQLKETNSVFKKQLYLSQLEDYILFKPAIAYQENIIPLYSAKKVITKKGSTEYEIPRNKEFEVEFNKELRALHPKFEYQTNEFFFLEEENLMENEWFLSFFEKTKELEIDIFGRNDLKLKYNQNKANISININSEIDWFDVNINISFGDQQVSLKDVKKNIINKNKYVALKDGTIGILPSEWMEKYLSVFKSGTISKDGLKVSKYQFSAVDTLYENYENETNLFDEHLKIREKLNNFSAVKNIRTPKGIDATLRPYQKEGLKWLNFLDDFNLGGCLADDMGLGKTLQIISFLKHIKTKRKPKQAHLVVVPTSLIFNWNEEIKKFCPELKAHTHAGLKREKSITKFSDFDIIITTYGLIINDSKMLSEYEFHYVILDESQAIKNPNSKRYKAIKVLKAKNRLVMTGTPIENNTFDLYAQMNFINPGLLGGIQQFKQNYANAIDKNNDVAAAEELKKTIHPFLMRRTKEQVMTDLPPKTEQIIYCTMGKEQRKVYDAFKNEYRNYLTEKIDEQGFEKSQMYILEALTKLRQICNSPSLLSNDEEYTDESIKIDLLLENIIDKTGKHKILVFSQFTSMLGLIKNRLEDNKITYEYLDGSTRNRQEKVENFQNNEDIRVFLISLKAGGTGLNLTAADYVYIVDPWWNPAAEAQAIDRCYRIGQNKKVMAYKMICTDSIEEKIVQLQDGKKQVSNDLIQTEKSFVKKLTKNSLQDLFK